jgi:asparagine synthase (glutamine-hydrolysing)
MPGIAGYVRDSGEEAGRAFLDSMMQRLESNRDLYKTDGYCDRGMGLGRAALGILNPGPQPVWSRDRNLCLVMTGEFFEIDELRDDLVSRGYEFSGNGNAELLLGLFETFGEECAVQLNGAFVAAIWDRRAKKLTVINDRLGLCPLYYALINGDLVFASGVRALLADPHLSREIDKLALSQFLTFDHMLDDRTLLSSVRLFPQASVLTFERGDLRIRPYWRLQYPVVYRNRTQEELLEEFILRMRDAMRRQGPGKQAAGLLLSGGLDSRMILALLREVTDMKEFHTFTWGIPGCDDARLASELARLAATRHHFFELRPDYLLRTAENAVRITEGHGNIVNLHALATLEQTVKRANVIYKGFLGDAMMGFALQRPFWGDYEPEIATEVHLGIHDYQGVLNYSQSELSGLLTDSVVKEVGTGVLDSYREGMNRSGNRQLATQRLYFDFTQRVPRMTLNGVEVVRSLAAVRLPFADNDLVDFSLSVPPGYHFGRFLMRTSFVQSFPDFAKIPVSDTGLPMISCARDVRLRAYQFLRWHLNNSGINWLARPTRRPYKDYSNWFRGVLKGWLESTLLSPGSLERGYFRPEAVKRLVAEHMAGADHTVRLGALVTLELWHQQFVD